MNSPEAHAAISTHTARSATAVMTTAQTTQTAVRTMNDHSHAITKEGTAAAIIGQVAIIATVEGSHGAHITVGAIVMDTGDVAISRASAGVTENYQAACHTDLADTLSMRLDLGGVIIEADISADSRECDEAAASVGMLGVDREWDSRVEADLRLARFLLPMRTTTAK